MNLKQRLDIMKKQETNHEILVREIKELPRYGKECCMDPNSDSTQTEFEICEDAWDRGDCLVEIVWDDGSDLIGFKHCIVCGGEYRGEWGIEMTVYRIYSERFIELDDDEDIVDHLEGIVDELRLEDYHVEESKWLKSKWHLAL